MQNQEIELNLFLNERCILCTNENIFTKAYHFSTILINFDVGKSKSTFGWSSLHLSSYFGHLETCKVLLECGAEPNILNNTGDSPLHKAALTNREVKLNVVLVFSLSLV